MKTTFEHGTPAVKRQINLRFIAQLDSAMYPLATQELNAIVTAMEI